MASSPSPVTTPAESPGHDDKVENKDEAVEAKDDKHHVTCDVCGVDPVVGVRYECTVCYNFDMCESCEASKKHNQAHPLVIFRDPDANGLQRVKDFVKRVLEKMNADYKEDGNVVAFKFDSNNFIAHCTPASVRLGVQAARFNESLTTRYREFAVRANYETNYGYRMIVNNNSALLVSDVFVNMFSSSSAGMSDVLTAIIPDLSLTADMYNAAMRKSAQGMSVKEAVGEALGNEDSSSGGGSGSGGGGQAAALLALLQMLQQHRDASD
eukprot:TRINITY_DN3425_c0_g1_i1.p1 TRINITY_DN3425_c0_g1~~TRINITY_DN3425_c0_g1_i1.p1  ORF type:complete len:268 (-),score=76.53 TRINITY_DN3425_c0_g1_i1:628-1431(-)